MKNVEYRGPVPPTADPQRNDRWYDPKTGMLFVYDGRNWIPAAD